MAILDNGNSNLNIDGAVTSYVDFGGSDTYTLLSSLSADVTITDNQTSTINLPSGLTISDALFLSDGVQFTINGNTVTLIGNPSLYTFVFGGTPLDPAAGTPLSFADTAAAFGTTIPAPGAAPNAATTTGDVNEDGSVGAAGTPEEIYAQAIADANDALADAAAAQQAADDAEAAVVDLATAEAYKAAADAAKAAADAAKAAADAAAAAAADTADGADDTEAAAAVAAAEAAVATADAEVASAEAEVEAFAPPTFELTGPATVNEADGATYTVTASKPVLVDTEVTFQLVAGDASAPDQGTTNTNLNDFAQGAFTATTVTILAGETTAEYVVASKNDGITELSEDFSVSASVDGTDLAPVTSTILDGATIGDTFFLTDGADEIVIETVGTIDTVRGIIDNANDNTFSTADIIEGNGLTEVRVTLVDTTSGAADFVEMEGVNTLDLRGAGGTTPIAFDASTYGSDLSNVMLSGADGADVSVTDVSFDDDAIMIEIAEGTTGDLNVTGSNDLFSTLTLDIAAAAGAGGGSIISDIGGAGLEIMAGEDVDVQFDALNDVTETGTDAVIDALSVGDVNLMAGENASVDVSITLSASAVTSGDATIGDVTIGMVNLTGGLSSDVGFSLDEDASATSGNATLGNLTIGDVSLDGAESADLVVYFERDAAVTTGDAVIGHTTVGNIDIVLADDAAEADFTIDVSATADTGNASIGDTTIGNITVDLGNDVGSDVTISISNSASADTSGDATVGSVLIGNIDAMIGESSDFTVDVYQYATADSGDATIGDITVGDVNVTMGDDGYFSLTLSNFAQANPGNATVGDVTVGDVDLIIGTSASANIYMFGFADASTGDGVVGNMTLGSINAVMDVDSYLYMSLSAEATGTGTMTAIGDISVGDITLGGPVAISATASLYMFMQSDGGIGTVTVGDVDVDFLDDSFFDYYISLSTSGSDGAIGAVTLGDVDIVADDIYYEVEIDGELTAGVTVGDVMLSGDRVQMSGIQMNASEEIGDVVIGDIMIDAADTLTLTSGVVVDATDDIGSVTIGDVMIDAPNAETFDIQVYTDRDLLGDVALGNVDLTARSGAFLIRADVDVSGDSGDVIVGDVSLVATDAATAQFSVDASATGTAGDVMIGDVSLAATISDTANAANVNFDALSDGNLTVGDISLSAAYTGAADPVALVGVVSLDVTLVASGDITVGDISVSGGIQNTAGTAVMDNLGTFTAWFTATAGGDVTIGDVDYSGFVSDADIDVSAFDGAENIMAAEGDTIITVNDTTNNVTLGDGDDEVEYLADEQSGTTYAEIDKIINFSSGDDAIDLTFITGASVAVGATVADYDAFLVTAQQVMTNFGDDVVTLNDGTNTYVGVDSDNDSVLDFAIELTGVTAVTAGDFLV